MAWDTEEIRKGREDDWFRQNEAQMMEAARKKREAAESAEKTAESEELRKAHWRKCPKCGHDMAVETISGIEVERCSSCGGVFFDRGELEQVLVKHEDRRGFFRRLMGYADK